MEEIEETKKQLAEAVKAEDKEPEQEEEVEKTSEAAPEEEAQEAEADSKETAEEQPDPAAEKPDDSSFARMRREKKALERRVQELEARQNQAPVHEEPKKVEAVADADPEPDRQVKYEAWLEWNLRQHKKELAEIKGTVAKTTQLTERERLVNAAVQEFQGYEADYRAVNPSYDKAAEFYTKELTRSFKLLNPKISSAEAGELIRNTVLNKASSYAKLGLDPAEELYNEAVSFGFRDNQEESIQEEVKPSLRKIAANKSRNSGMAGAKGRGTGGPLTREAASELSVAEWAKLSQSEKKRLLTGG
jgi:hypothetical protein